MNMHRLIIILFSLSLLVTLIFSRQLESLFDNPLTHSELEQGDSSSKVANPLYRELSALAKQHSINLNITKETWIKEHKDDMHSWSFFEAPLNSYDIIIMGDSSLAWGLIPTVIEQKSGLSVGNFAFEANILTPASLKIFEKVTSCFLKPGGKVLFSFNVTNQEQSAELYRLPGMSAHGAELTTYVERINNTDECRKIFPKPSALGTEKTGHWLLFKNYQKKLDEIRYFLKIHGNMELPKISIYESYLEKYFNAEKHAKKSDIQNSEKLFLQWDDRTVTLYNPNFTDTSWPMHTPYFVDHSINPNTKVNMNALVEFSKKYDSYYVVPLFSAISPRNRQFYHAFLSKHLGLIDIPAYFASRGTPQVTMEGGTHPGNTGGLQLSLAIANILSDFANQNLSGAQAKNVMPIEPLQYSLPELLQMKDRVIFLALGTNAKSSDYKSLSLNNLFYGDAASYGLPQLKGLPPEPLPDALQQFIAIYEEGTFHHFAYKPEKTSASYALKHSDQTAFTLKVSSKAQEPASFKAASKQLAGDFAGLHVLVYEKSSSSFLYRLAYPFHAPGKPENHYGRTY